MKEANYIFIYNYNHFRPIFLPHDQVPPYYLISYWGAIFSTWLGEYLSQTETSKGYMVVSLQTIDGRRIQERVHRLVKYTFDYIPGCEYLEVDHLNGVKNDNRLENLDWVTSKENIRRSNENGLAAHAQILYEADIANICQLILEGYSDEQISTIVPNANKMRIGEIIQGRCGTKYISRELLEQMRAVRREINRAKSCTVFSDAKKAEVCKFFQDNPFKDNPEKFKYNKRIYIDYTMNNLELENSPENRRLVRRLLNKEGNESITSQFNY